MELSKKHTCCIFGKGKIEDKDELVKELNNQIEALITEEKVDTFLFGRKSEFDILCFYVVTTLKEKYPDIKRIYTRTDFPFINGEFVDYDRYYDDTYYPGRILQKEERTVYRGRNEEERLDMSGFCLLYEEAGLQTEEPWFDFEYAKQKEVCVMNVGEQTS